MLQYDAVLVLSRIYKLHRKQRVVFTIAYTQHHIITPATPMILADPKSSNPQNQRVFLSPCRACCCAAVWSLINAIYTEIPYYIICSLTIDTIYYTISYILNISIKDIFLHPIHLTQQKRNIKPSSRSIKSPLTSLPSSKIQNYE